MSSCEYQGLEFGQANLVLGAESLDALATVDHVSFLIEMQDHGRWAVGCACAHYLQICPHFLVVVVCVCERRRKNE